MDAYFYKAESNFSKEDYISLSISSIDMAESLINWLHEETKSAMNEGFYHEAYKIMTKAEDLAKAVEEWNEAINKREDENGEPV